MSINTVNLRAQKCQGYGTNTKWLADFKSAKHHFKMHKIYDEKVNSEDNKTLT